MASIHPKITINGVASTSITGLMICSLPPISKAPLRAQAEEIDGRDGDVITKLGYGAYDKPFTIGLSGSYDIDAVIGYFNSEGKITFSNEPEKYYLFSQFDQIDFEKLIRFKIAKVTMHVQPFKFSAVEYRDSFVVTGSMSSKTLFNRGNISSKPKLTIYGDGIITISINGTLVFAIDMTDIDKITIDGETMNAFDGDTYLNRRVMGSYDNLRFVIGRNVLSWTGTVDLIEVENFSRWI